MASTSWFGMNWAPASALPVSTGVVSPLRGAEALRPEQVHTHDHDGNDREGGGEGGSSDGEESGPRVAELPIAGTL